MDVFYTLHGFILVPIHDKRGYQLPSAQRSTHSLDYCLSDIESFRLMQEHGLLTLTLPAVQYYCIPSPLSKTKNSSLMDMPPVRDHISGSAPSDEECSAEGSAEVSHTRR